MKHLIQALESSSSASKLLGSATGEAFGSTLQDDITEAMTEALDEFAVDFARTRLPPPKDSIEWKEYIQCLPKRKIKTNDRIRLIKSEWVHFVVTDVDMAHSEIQDGAKLLRIYNCMDNNRETHMGFNISTLVDEERVDTEPSRAENEQDNCVSAEIDEEMHRFLRELKKAYPEYVTVPEGLIGFANVMNEANTITLI